MGTERNTVVVIDQTRQLKLGITPEKHELLSFNELKVSSGDIDLFHSVLADSKLIKTINAQVVVLVLDWLATHKWHVLLNAVGNTNLIITTVNYREATKSKAAAVLNTDIDVCHQYLRTRAMKMHALLVYSLIDPPDLLPFVLHQLQLQTHSFEQNYLGPLFVISEDSKERIMALNPGFDMANSLNDDYKLPQLQKINVPEAEVEPESLFEVLRTAIKEAEKVPTAHIERMPEITDDKEVIGEFFHKIAQRSS